MDVQSGQATQSNVAIDAAVRTNGIRLVFGRPSSSRRPGRRRYAAGVSRAFAAGRRTRPAVRERPRFDRQPCATATDRRPARHTIHSVPGTLAVLGTFQCVAAAARASHSRSTPAPRRSTKYWERRDARVRPSCSRIIRSFRMAISRVSRPVLCPADSIPHFDLLEINADVSSYNEKVCRRSGSFWNAGHRYYLSGGTDVHDVWNQESGRVRTFAHLDGEPTAQSFAEAVKAGHGVRVIRAADPSVGDVRQRLEAETGGTFRAGVQAAIRRRTQTGHLDRRRLGGRDANLCGCAAGVRPSNFR